MDRAPMPVVTGCRPPKDCGHDDRVRSPDGDCLVFQRVGRFIEFYGPQRVLAERVLRLRRVYLPRAGYGFLAGFPVWLAGRFGERALRCGVSFVTPASEAQSHVTAIIWPDRR